ncbi:hypothetical protein [Streptomyces sp. CdTB01]|uniref:hypothetical protein n=1 Tax=Streptomyces sp. CdTB01 TaxID=1725411 RepID=UPI00073A5683|nr:hypothetical protein [Streptomyces sp. CdTB01]ALV39159.1 hypothetical protein AS200_44395 [Streptomyces sp. CdTB01]
MSRISASRLSLPQVLQADELGRGSWHLPGRWRRPSVPICWDQPITEMSDLIFSRANAATLP